MLSEMLRVVRMRQVLDLRIVPVVTARLQPQVRQPHAAVPGGDALVARDARITIGVEEIEYLARDGAAQRTSRSRVGRSGGGTTPYCHDSDSCSNHYYGRPSRILDLSTLT
jgi:hypothetical protein